jgi:C1A family cysteine protease
LLSSQDGYCHSNKAQSTAVIDTPYNVSGTAALLSALATVGPISVSVDASVPTFYFYASGTYDDPACQSSLDALDHTILAVGYGVDANNNQYWIVRNNWSVYWGQSGYAYVATANNVCGVATAPTYATVK